MNHLGVLMLGFVTSTLVIAGAVAGYCALVAVTTLIVEIIKEKRRNR